MQSPTTPDSSQLTAFALPPGTFLIVWLAETMFGFIAFLRPYYRAVFDDETVALLTHPTVFASMIAGTLGLLQLVWQICRWRLDHALRRDLEAAEAELRAAGLRPGQGRGER